MSSRIVVFDTSIVSENLGDFVIMDAVNAELPDIAQDRHPIWIPTHANTGKRGLKPVRLADFCIVGGSNLMTANPLSYRQWKFKLTDLRYLNNAILMGAGWWSYQEKPSWISGVIWRRVLHADYLHSVRDEYTADMLRSIGMDNVLNTGCPSMWGLTPEHCSQIPTEKGDEVTFTINQYRSDAEADARMINTLAANYRRVCFWPQSPRDAAYLRQLEVDQDRIEMLRPQLPTLNACFDNDGRQMDYVGCRLHAGMRALQKKCRTTIVGVDNRALEKARSFGLPVIDRKDIGDLGTLINGTITTEIELPMENITKFRQQFRERASG